jgi:hypothetical protein
LPDVGSFAMNYGVKLDKLKVALTRSGLLNATLSLIAQGETIATSPSSGVQSGLSTLQTLRFAQASGSISRAGTPLAGITSADFTFANNLETVDVIRSDSRIDGADEGQSQMTGTINARFADTTLLTQAINKTPCVLAFAWSAAGGMGLSVTAHRVFLPKVKRSIDGPKGIQVPFAFQASEDPTLNKSVTIVLTNDVSGY